MRVPAVLFAVLLTCGLGAQIDAPAQQQALLRAAVAQESAFSEALGNYTYRQDFSFQELSNQNHERGGSYQVITDITFTPDGRRLEQIVRGPYNHLRFLRMTRQDFADLRTIVPLILTRGLLWEYTIRDLGRQQIEMRDSAGRVTGRLETEAFTISPRQIFSNHRYLEGKMWIDPVTQGIVKISGRPVPDVRVMRHGREEENLFGRFTTWRQRVDGHFWFPVFTEGQDWLGFRSGPVEVSERVTYSHFEQFHVHARIVGVKPR